MMMTMKASKAEIEERKKCGEGNFTMHEWKVTFGLLKLLPYTVQASDWSLLIYDISIKIHVIWLIYKIPYIINFEQE